MIEFFLYFKQIKLYNDIKSILVKVKQYEKNYKTYFNKVSNQ